MCGDQYHPAAPVMTGLDSAGGSEYDFIQAPDGSPELLVNQYDCVILAKCNVKSPTDLDPWVSPEADEMVREYVVAGGGLFVVHGGSAGYGETRWIRQLTGGKFLTHPTPCPVKIQSTKSGDPLEPFEVFDEHYVMEMDTGIDIFLESVSEQGTQPAGWISRFGQGKICVLTPGHFAEIWGNPHFHNLLKSGLDWVSNE